MHDTIIFKAKRGHIRVKVENLKTGNLDTVADVDVTRARQMLRELQLAVNVATDKMFRKNVA